MRFSKNLIQHSFMLDYGITMNINTKLNVYWLS